MKGIEVYGMTYWSNTIRNLDKASLTLMDEILDLVKNIEAKDDESPRYLWITEQRGTLAEYKKCKNYNDEIRTKKDFQAYFPYEKIWLEFCGLHNRYAKLICINKLRFEIDTREDYVQDSFCYDFTEILTWLKEKVEATIQEIKEGTYNDKVWNELPYEYRYGTISRKVYYDHFPEAREEDFNGITEEEKQRFLQIVANENRNITERFKDMTFNKYFEMPGYGTRSDTDGCRPARPGIQGHVPHVCGTGPGEPRHVLGRPRKAQDRSRTRLTPFRDRFISGLPLPGLTGVYHGQVDQPGRSLPSQGRSREFESRLVHHCSITQTFEKRPIFTDSLVPRLHGPVEPPTAVEISVALMDA